MNENVQPQEEQVESGEQVESTERAEAQAVEDATHEPEARVEQTQDYEQAEAVEGAVTEAMDNAEQAEAQPEPEPAEGGEERTEETVQQEQPAKAEAEESPEARTESSEGDEEEPPAECDPGDLPDGSGRLDQSEQEVVEVEVQEPAPGDTPEVADEVEIEVAGEDGTVDRDEPAMVDGSELSPASEGEGDQQRWRGSHAHQRACGPPNRSTVDGRKPKGWLARKAIRNGRRQARGHPYRDPRCTAECDRGAGRDGTDPIPKPSPEGQIARDDSGGGGKVAEMPEPGGNPPGPNQVAELDTVETQAKRAAKLTRPGGEVAATPINLPREADVIEGAQGEQVAHVDHWSEMPDPGEEPPPPNLEAEVYPETADRLSEEAEIGATPWIRVADDGSELMQELETTLEAGVEGEIPQEGETEETAPEALAEEGEAEEDVPSEAEEQKDAPDWYIHEDSEGNVTVVDENGKPVDSPPKIVYFKGKYYAVYPGGDDFPVNEDGSVTDPQKLAEHEISAYKPSTEGMKVYSGKDGTTVVDENGDPVESPPAVIQDPATGKYYFVTESDPGKLSSFTKSGNFKDALAQGLIKEAPGYQPSTEGLKVYSGKDGTTVVDENGKPVESPPAVIQDPATGKYYFVTESDPSKLSSFTKSGNFKDALAQGLIKEAPGYQPSTEGMKVYSGKDGAVVVDENGKPVESPPAVIQDPATGKYYFVKETDPGKMSSFTKSGNFKDALAQGLIAEAPGYQPSTEGMKVYSGKDGAVVVDENGNPVESPPAVIQDPATGKYYFVKETDPGKMSSFTKSGNFKDALAQGLIAEAPGYQPSTVGIQIYPDDDGNPIVVDWNGKPVESPPACDPRPGYGQALLRHRDRSG